MTLLGYFIETMWLTTIIIWSIVQLWLLIVIGVLLCDGALEAARDYKRWKVIKRRKNIKIIK